MSKYKIGDKVRIVKERTDKMNREGEMDNYLGTVMTVSSNFISGQYSMEEDYGEWTWFENMIVGLARRKVRLLEHRYSGIVGDTGEFIEYDEYGFAKIRVEVNFNREIDIYREYNFMESEYEFIDDEGPRVGDVVEIIDSGLIYTLYDKWVEKYCPKYYSRFNQKISCGDTIADVGDVGELLATGIHQNHGRMLGLVQISEKLVIIQLNGLTIVEKGNGFEKLEGDDSVKIYKVDDMIRIWREQPDRKFTSDGGESFVYYDKTENRAQWGGRYQEGQGMVVGRLDREYYDYRESIRPMDFQELCEYMEENSIYEISVTYEGKKYTGYMDDLLIELGNALFTSELVEIFLDGEWYIEEEPTF